MQNNINNVSFNANLKILTKIDNKSAVADAKNIFKNATKDYPNDSLYISTNQLGETVVSLCNDTKKDIGTKNIDKQISEMGVNEFAEKLIKMFSSLKLHEETFAKLTNIKKEVSRLTKAKEFNTNAARNWNDEGKHFIANRYNVLAKNNEALIARLETEKQTLKSNYNKKIEDLSKQYKEMIQLKIG